MTGNDGRRRSMAAGAICCVALPACFNPIFDHPRCGPMHECPGTLQCSVQGTCEQVSGGSRGTWTFDSVAGFGAFGAAFSDITLSPLPWLTPQAYLYGGLIAHGLPDVQLWTRGDTSWNKLDGMTAAGAGLWHGESINSGSIIDYLGIPGTGARMMTIWFEGEVWLEAGMRETFTLAGDDVAFVGLARPGSTGYERITELDGTVPVATPVTGWYPIRIGFSNGEDGVSNLEFTHSDSAETPVAWTRARLRARASEMQGVLRMVFARQVLACGQVSTTTSPVARFEQSELLTPTTFDGIAQGVVTTDNSDWSARYLGQIYIVEPGAYTLQIVSDDGNHGRLGGEEAATDWARNSAVNVTATTTVSATLARGWNDVVVDYNQLNGARLLDIQLQGPDYPTFTAVPLDRLRPAEPHDDRLVCAIDEARHNVPDNGGPANPGTATMSIAGFPGETVAAIDLMYELDTSRGEQIRVDLEAPGAGTRRMIRDHGTLVGLRTMHIHISADDLPPLVDLLGGPASGAWKLHVYDDVAGTSNNTSIRSARITLHTTGGPDKIARIASWTSPVLDGSTLVRSVDSASWDGRVPDGATLEVRIQTCQQADCKDDPAWSQPIPKAAPFVVEPGRYVRLRVDMTSNGILEPELRSLTVRYRRDP